MKRTIFTFLVIMFAASMLNAQALFFVGGNVTNLNGGAIPNHHVFIKSDSTSSYSYSNYTLTDSTGYYSFNITTVPANGTIVTFYVYTEDCNGIHHYDTITNANPQNTVNFSICNSNTSSCQATFTYTVSGTNNNEIHFADQSTGTPTTWTWTFGDGTSGTGSTAVHTYSIAGTYVVCLTITTASGCSSSVCDTINVNTSAGSSCHAAFTFYPDSLNGTVNMYAFVNSSTSTYTGYTVTYLWNFGDGTTSTDLNPTHQFANATGSYTVCLIMEVNSANTGNDIVCSDSTCTTIQLSNPSSACQNSFTFTNNNLIYTFQGSINSTLPTTYQWNFGDGTTANDMNVTHTFVLPASGTNAYQVCLITVTTDSNGNECYDTTCQSITISSNSGTIIQGYVYAGNSPVTSGYVVLYQANNTTMSYTVFDTLALNSNGYYYYNYVNVPPVNPVFIIKAFLNTSSPIYSNYFPTYYTATLNWYNATTVSPSTDSVYYNIYLVPLPGAASGNGSIGGNVGNSGKSSTSVSGAEVILMDGNSNPLTMKLTDANGNYSFSNLAAGNYKLVVDMIGESCTIVSITISSGSPNVNGVNFVVSGANITASIDETVWFANHVSDVYPNPSNGDASIDFSLLKPNKISIKTYNNLGQLVLTNESEYGAGSHKVMINTNQLTEGVYTIQISSGNSTSIIKKFIKTR